MNDGTDARRIPGRPTLRSQVQRRVGGVICRYRGHRPVLVETHYYVSAGPVELVGAGRDLLSDLTFPVLGRRGEERLARHSTRLSHRRCRGEERVSWPRPLVQRVRERLRLCALLRLGRQAGTLPMQRSRLR